MTGLAVTLVAVACAVALARVLPRRFRLPLAMLALAAPVVWSLPGTLRREGAEVWRHRGLPAEEADFIAPFVRRGQRWPNDPDLVRFARLVVRVTPPGAELSAGGSTGTTWVRFLAFAVAPRLVVEGQTPWEMSREGLPPAATQDSWQVGEYWLVRR